MALSARAIVNMRVMRQVRGWSVRQLAEMVTAAGCPIAAASLVQVDMGRRKAMTVDELFALARVFGVTAQQLVYGPACASCGDRPAPAGFVCVACGRERCDGRD